MEKISCFLVIKPLYSTTESEFIYLNAIGKLLQNNAKMYKNIKFEVIKI